MKSDGSSRLALILSKDGQQLLNDWVRNQGASTTLRGDLLNTDQLQEQSRGFLRVFQAAIARGDANIQSVAWEDVRGFLAELSRSRAQNGFSPTETATFIFSLKQPLFVRLREQLADQPEAFADTVWSITLLLDSLGLYCTEVAQRNRDELIHRQQQELMELSTPVVELWENIVALPLVGTLDSSRTQVVMETLLQKIVDNGAAIAIIDITGVPTVDTLVAQHLMKTVAATRLMGAECIISGIRPQIAQTIVHLGVNLGDVITKATLADAFQVALRNLGARVVSTDRPASR